MTRIILRHIINLLIKYSRHNINSADICCRKARSFNNAGETYNNVNKITKWLILINNFSQTKLVVRPVQYIAKHPSFHRLTIPNSIHPSMGHYPKSAILQYYH
jgi:hypothetical protein